MKPPDTTYCFVYDLQGSGEHLSLEYFGCLSWHPCCGPADLSDVDDAVTAPVFGFIQRLVGPLEGVGGGIATAKQGGSDRDGDLHLVIFETKGNALDHVAQLVQRHIQVVRLDPW